MDGGLVICKSSNKANFEISKTINLKKTCLSVTLCETRERSTKWVRRPGKKIKVAFYEVGMATTHLIRTEQSQQTNERKHDTKEEQLNKGLFDPGLIEKWVR